MTAEGPGQRLLLVRHSKAEHTSGIEDHHRQLTERGWRDAQALGAWLAAQSIDCDLVLCSTSVRTRQTWEGAVRGGASERTVQLCKSVYLGGAAAILRTIREEAADLRTVMVVGHSPSMPVLTSLLSGDQGSSDARQAAAAGFPTSAAAVLGYGGRWADLGPSTATLEHFHVARG